MDDFKYHRPIISNACPPIWSTKSLRRSKKKIRLRLVYQPFKVWGYEMKHSSPCWCINSQWLDTGKKQSLSCLHIISGCLHFRWKKKTPSRVWHIVLGVWIPHKTLFLVSDILITGDWKSDETFVFDVRRHGVSTPHKTLLLVFDMLLTSLGARCPRVL